MHNTLYRMISAYLPKHSYQPVAHPLLERVVVIGDELIVAHTTDPTEFDFVPKSNSPSFTDCVNAGVKMPILGQMPLNGVQAAQYEAASIGRLQDYVLSHAKPKPVSVEDPKPVPPLNNENHE